MYCVVRRRAVLRVRVVGDESCCFDKLAWQLAGAGSPSTLRSVHVLYITPLVYWIQETWSEIWLGLSDWRASRIAVQRELFSFLNLPTDEGWFGEGNYGINPENPPPLEKWVNENPLSEIEMIIIVTLSKRYNTINAFLEYHKRMLVPHFRKPVFEITPLLSLKNIAKSNYFLAWILWWRKNFQKNRCFKIVCFVSLHEVLMMI